MHGIGWIIASLPLFGLVAVLAEIAIQDPRVITEMATDCEAFARGKARRAEQVDMAPSGLVHA